MKLIISVVVTVLSFAVFLVTYYVAASPVPNLQPTNNIICLCEGTPSQFQRQIPGMRGIFPRTGPVPNPRVAFHSCPCYIRRR